VSKRKKITETQRNRLAVACKNSLHHLSEILQVFLQIRDNENAIKIKKAMLSIQVTCNRKQLLPHYPCKDDNKKTPT